MKGSEWGLTLPRPEPLPGLLTVALVPVAVPLRVQIHPEAQDIPALETESCGKIS